MTLYESKTYTSPLTIGMMQDIPIHVKYTVVFEKVNNEWAICHISSISKDLLALSLDNTIVLQDYCKFLDFAANHLIRLNG